jgi:hypothetical protein
MAMTMAGCLYILLHLYFLSVDFKQALQVRTTNLYTTSLGFIQRLSFGMHHLGESAQPSGLSTQPHRCHRCGCPKQFKSAWNHRGPQ